ncbi:DNA mismatch repair endonuclease MutL [Desulfosarcina sp. OttesenSCG-928-A07]|nr:DNA mismatch repair endonuclease MutL [Desulfosarcina sp. OttesenSCG-928-G17]MDL2328946.1 DNA mismatch repair endonuclease MutL [Desulfosarcina sp. OttesenSCG-928-A07]
MSKVRILPETLSNKIAAGEVVERPFSVVKELVENAIDAGSTRILVEIEKGGRKLIRVSDNGHGMGRDDALLCLERYATSKIRTDPDLFAIRTLGFRGEALPSIAAISRFSLVTREASADVGTRIVVEGGKIITVADTGAPVGAMISVGDLFYNTPARRKFLKSIDTEMGHIADTLASMGLCHPAIQFRLSHDQRVIKNWPSVTDPLERVADVLGRSLKEALHPVTGKTDAVRISGWAATPRISRSTTRGIYLFVNGRWVRDRVLQHAILAGYSGRLMKGQYPVAVLFLEVPFDQVDVNVHPAKHEIRFLLQQQIHDAVSQAVAKTLEASDPALKRAFFPPSPPVPGADAAAVSEPLSFYHPKDPATAKDFQASPAPFVLQGTEQDDAIHRKMDTPSVLPPSGPPLSASFPSTDAVDKTFHQPEPASVQAAVTASGQTPLWKRRFFSDLHVIGQYRGTYIICESDDGLILIDQHAAHERIVFERLKSRTFLENPVVQRLMLPEPIELGFHEARILTALIPQLDRYGMEIEPFGNHTFVVKALPTLLDSGSIRELIVRLVEKSADVEVSADTQTLMDNCLMVMACHNAIRANQRLSPDQIRAMLKDLDQSENPSHCPHGRPIWIRWKISELEKQFRRIN